MPDRRLIKSLLLFVGTEKDPGRAPRGLDLTRLLGGVVPAAPESCGAQPIGNRDLPPSWGSAEESERPN